MAGPFKVDRLLMDPVPWKVEPVLLCADPVLGIGGVWLVPLAGLFAESDPDVPSVANVR